MNYTEQILYKLQPHTKEAGIRDLFKSTMTAGGAVAGGQAVC